MMIDALMICAIGLCPQSGGAPKAQWVAQSIPFAEFDLVASVAEAPPFGSLIGGEGASVRALVMIENGPDMRESVMSLLRQVVARTGPTGEEFTVDRLGGRMIMTGRSENVTLAAKVMKDLTQAVTQPFEIEARLYEISDSERLDVRLPAGGLKQLEPRLGAGELWRRRGWVRSGASLSMAQNRQTAYLRDADVEVAQEQDVADPQVAALFEGIHLSLEAHAVAGGEDIVLYASAVVAELDGEMRTRPSGVADMSTFDVPTLRNNRVTFSGRIEDGGALVATVDGDPSAGSRFALVIQARRPNSRTSTADDGIEALPISALTTQSLRDRVSSAPATQGSVFPLKATRSFDSSQLDIGVIKEMALQGVYQAYESGELVLEGSGGFLFVVGSAANRKSVRDAIVAIQDQWIETVECEIETVALPTTAGGRVFGSTGANGRAESGSMMHRVRAPMMIGRSHMLLRGLESTATSDLEVEIAEDASAVNPVVVSTFSGVFANVIPRGGRDRLSVIVDVDVASTSEPKRRAAETKHGGDLYLPEVARSQFSLQGPMPPTVVSLGDAGVVSGRQSQRLEQHLQLRPLR